MSCYFEWDRVVQIALRARDESIGADHRVTSRNINATMTELYNIAKRFDCADEFKNEWGPDYDGE